MKPLIANNSVRLLPKTQPHFHTRQSGEPEAVWYQFIRFAPNQRWLGFPLNPQLSAKHVPPRITASASPFPRNKTPKCVCRARMLKPSVIQSYHTFNLHPTSTKRLQAHRGPGKTQRLFVGTSGGCCESEKQQLILYSL